MNVARSLMGLLLALSPVSAVQAEQGSAPAFENAWIREAPPGAEVMAGYVTIHVRAGTSTALTSAGSTDFARVELHEMTMTDGVMRMRPLERVELPAGKTVALAPGGLHLMLFEPKRPLRAGDRVTLEFVLEDRTRHSVEFEVRKPTEASGSGHQH